MRGHTPFYELQVALTESGCPICRLTVRALERFFAGVVYERVNEPALRESIRRSYGFCADHGAMLRAARSALGSAIIQRDVLRAASAALEADASRDQGRGWLATLRSSRSPHGPLAPEIACVGCTLADEQSAHWIAILIQHYVPLRADFQSSSGLCLDHIRALLAVAPLNLIDTFRTDQRAIWAQLEAELDELIRKHDHQFTHEPMGRESDSWARATDLLSGDARAIGSRRRSSS